jgi:hypothetical protein
MVRPGGVGGCRRPAAEHDRSLRYCGCAAMTGRRPRAGQRHGEAAPQRLTGRPRALPHQRAPELAGQPLPVAAAAQLGPHTMGE